MKEQFLNSIADIMHGLDKTDKSSMEKMRLLTFCIFVILDGEDAFLPPFKVQPIDEEGKISGEDIAGSLHDDWNKKFK